MPGNSIGTSFRVTTFGESHGAAVGVIVDGVTPGVKLSEEDIQPRLDRRKPGQSEAASPREEPDRVHILSGVFQGRTTGTPLFLMLYNRDARSEDYLAIKDLFRPGHADYTYLAKYGIRDYRGSGRASGRETAARVAAGAVAQKLLERIGVTIVAYTHAVAGVVCTEIDETQIDKNVLRAPDAGAAAVMLEEVRKAREAGDSVGGIVACRIRGLPAGLGEPVFDRLDADLAKAVLSIGSVKAIEFGGGFRLAAMRGSEANDQMSRSGFLTNHAGGILGGISTGEEILFRIAVKPTSSIALPQKTIGVDGEEREMSTKGRHDPCICPRIVPVVEAMAAIVLVDHLKRQAALHG